MKTRERLLLFENLPLFATFSFYERQETSSLFGPVSPCYQKINQDEFVIIGYHEGHRVLVGPTLKVRNLETLVCLEDFSVFLEYHYGLPEFIIMPPEITHPPLRN
ncbi:MAG TPA: hypothetical protein VJC20_01490 [Candidatus Paceibacterota bacterium]